MAGPGGTPAKLAAITLSSPAGEAGGLAGDRVSGQGKNKTKYYCNRARTTRGKARLPWEARPGTGVKEDSRGPRIEDNHAQEDTGPKQARHQDPPEIGGVLVGAAGLCIQQTPLSPYYALSKLVHPFLLAR
jgi:hypothetical protein